MTKMPRLLAAFLFAVSLASPLPALAQAAPSPTASAPITATVQPPTAAPASNAAPALAADNLSPWGMFLHADIVVKAVICLLAPAVVLTWTIWLVNNHGLAYAVS